MTSQTVTTVTSAGGVAELGMTLSKVAIEMNVRVSIIKPA